MFETRPAVSEDIGLEISNNERARGVIWSPLHWLWQSSMSAIMGRYSAGLFGRYGASNVPKGKCHQSNGRRFVIMSGVRHSGGKLASAADLHVVFLAAL
ncbi:hypothetical protein RFM41_30925 [Mesorhizobium sp. VK25A]|uniref:Uncharacterized protein n=1 Tax=Mesorhizobium vachelliae TaxID=3072309 RepID=A0ABU5ADW5_9HYPH|nr:MULTISPECIES: hypothetical protein [unclassified Mesorhizobium]MDX8535470.1 hypothetical protein [Mesorhizobium sp. VK25D]MDX8548174.1 hypothetical protein [Mesorhizobium sp. VK25A]